MNLIAVLLLLWTLQTCANHQTEIPITYSVMHLQNTTSEKLAHHERICERLGLDHHNGMRDQLNHDFDLVSDYVFLKMPDGKIKITFKDYLPYYKACFDMNMLHTTSAVSWLKRKLSSDCDKRSYFASKFDQYSPTRVFHCVGNYRYKGFCDYVKKLPGFENFILNIGEQLKPGSALHKELTKSDNLQDFAALKTIHQEKVRELEQKAQIKHQEELRKILSARNFSERGIKLLEHHHIADQFLYAGNLEQTTQLKHITSFMNDVGEFRHEYHKTAELSEISDSAAGFGVLANNANRENLPATSQTLLEIGQNLLALGRGLVAGCVRNVSGIYHMAKDPVGTIAGLGSLIKNIGIGIADVATMIAKSEVGYRLNDQKLIDSAQQDMDRYVDNARQIYQYAKKAWYDKSKIERYELAGNLAADLLLAKGLPAVGKLAPIKNQAQYKPIAFAKLGNIGREINQIAGLACAKGAKAVQRGFEVVKNYPQIIQGQQLLGEAVCYGNKCLNVSNNYLRKISNQYLKSILNPERLMMRLGDKIKKLPKNCLAKTKQWLDEEAIVVDTFGNRWTSKMGSDEWLVNLSDKGKQSLTLLNESVASCAETINVSRKVKHRVMDYGNEVRQLLIDNKYKIKALVRNKYANTTFGEYYGPKVTEFLRSRSRSLHQKTLHIDGIDHLLLPSINQKIKSSGLIKENIVGLHLDIGRRLEQAGMYTLKNCKELVSGTYAADLHLGGLFKNGKTFFPSHWDCETLLNKISEACHNADQIVERGKGILEIKGRVTEGFDIFIRLNKRGKILTSYPI